MAFVAEDVGKSGATTSRKLETSLRHRYDGGTLPKARFDYGMSFGTSRIGTDDVQKTSLVLVLAKVRVTLLTLRMRVWGAYHGGRVRPRHQS